MVLDVLRGWRFVPPGQLAFEVPGGGTAVVLPTVHPASTRYRNVAEQRRARFRKDVQQARRRLESP